MLAEMRYAIHNSKSLVPLYDTLWENDNLREYFVSTTINIANLSDYNVFMIVCGEINDSDKIVINYSKVFYWDGIAPFVADAQKIYSYVHSSNMTLLDVKRSFEIDKQNGTIAISECVGHNINLTDGSFTNATTNNYLTPLYILGSKI